MKTAQQQLMKHFAAVLRGRALGTLTSPCIDKTLLRYLSRRQLIGIVSKRFDGTIPKEHDLTVMENGEILELIGDGMYVLAYMANTWCGGESPQTRNSPTTPTAKQPQKPKEHGKRTVSAHK